MSRRAPSREPFSTREKAAAVADPRALRYSFASGIFGSAMIGFTQEYLTPFLLLIGGTVRDVGFLNALPNLCAALIQIKSADVTEWIASRRKIVSAAFLVQSGVLAVAVVIALQRSCPIWLFILLAMLFAGIGAIANPPWGSWLADLVKPQQRGDYFGWRNRVLGFMTVSAGFGAGAILQAFKKVDVFYGFAFVFGLAMLSRLLSWLYVRRLAEPRLEHRPQDRFTLGQFLGKLRESNFARFVVFASALSFTVNMASPFFAVLMLKELHFNYILYSVITATATLTIFGAMHRWGRHADKVGNLKVISFVSPLIGVIPILWIFNRHPVYLIAAQVFSGFVWAGFNLCTSNFIYDAVTPEKRTRCIAYFNALNGTALCAGALCGGALLNVLPPLQGHKILSLFVVSGILRLAAGLFLPRLLREVRQVEPVSSEQLFFSMIGVRAMLGDDRKTLRL